MNKIELLEGTDYKSKERAVSRPLKSSVLKTMTGTHQVPQKQLAGSWETSQRWILSRVQQNKSELRKREQKTGIPDRG